MQTQRADHSRRHLRVAAPAHCHHIASVVTSTMLAFDHTMFIGVMTNVLLGVLAARLSSSRTLLANTVVWWGVNIGLAGFALGLITTTALLKQIFAPIMGLSLLLALGVYLGELRSATVDEDARLTETTV